MTKRQPLVIGVAVIAVVGIGAGLLATQLGGTSNKAASSTTSNESALAQGLAFYRGKTIDLVSPDSPGGGFDQWARLVAPVLASELHATVNVNNIPAGNTISGQDAVAHAAPNGLTIGWLNAGPDVENAALGLDAVNFNPESEVFLGATAPGQTAILDLNTPACAKWDSLSAILHNSSASDPVSEVLQTSGTGTFFVLMTNEAFGIHAHVLTGYSSTASQLQGFERGDGCLTDVPASVAAPLVTAHKATAVLLSVPLQSNSSIVKDFAGVPTVAEEASTFASSITTTAQHQALTALVDVDNSTRVLFAPTGTPAAEVAALENAFQRAMSNAGLEKSAISEGNPVGRESAATAKSQYAEFLTAAKKEVAILKPVVG